MTETICILPLSLTSQSTVLSASSPLHITLQRHFQEVVGVLVHECFGLGEGGEGPAVVEVAFLHGGLEVEVNEVGWRGDAQVPAEGLQQQQLHLDEVPLVQHQVETAHDAQRVELLQLGHAVLFLLKLA